ncbi:MAG TPA: helix-turn-helix domain-containing protein [Tabrizicola sp.]|nr:helix-turn-helix domain-containing protein [Tabrizicola sp.]
MVEIRIEVAKHGLEASDDPIDDLASSVGYLDPAAFRRKFRKIAGMTPQDHRRSYARLTRGVA